MAPAFQQWGPRLDKEKPRAEEVDSFQDCWGAQVEEPTLSTLGSFRVCPSLGFLQGEENGSHEFASRERTLSPED